jgi:transposase
MSTTVLYRMFNVRGYRFRKNIFVKGGMEIVIEQPRDKCRCPACDSGNIILRGKKTRRFLAPPIGHKSVTIVLDVPRVECVDCGVIRQVKIPFARPMCRYIRQFEQFVLDSLTAMTCEDVARMLGVSWGLIRDIESRFLTRKYAKPRLKDVTKIAIDEIAVRKGHKYMTIVMDLDTGKVLFVGDGKGSDALTPFWKRLRKSGATIQAVAIDMSTAYISAVENELPDAIFVFDRFHVIKMVNDKITQIRRRLYRENQDESYRATLKGIRWLLLKRNESLDPEKSELERLQKALELNQDLATGYVLKEELRELWDQEDCDVAEGMLLDWVLYAESTGIPELVSLAKSLRRHALGILAYYDCEITSGPIEGLNNKIKTMKRQAYGYRDMEYFKLKILAIHRTKYALVG